MKIANAVMPPACIALAAALSTAALASPPLSAAQGLVEVYFCVADQTGQTQGNVPVQLEYKGADGYWYVQRQGDSGSGCTSFFSQPAPNTYRVATVAANTGYCQGATPEAYAVPGPELNIGTLVLSCVIQQPTVLPSAQNPAVEVWLDADLDGVHDPSDRWPWDPTRS